MSIEAYFDDFINSFEKMEYETEEYSPLYDMMYEELDFLLGYGEKYGIVDKCWVRLTH